MDRAKVASPRAGASVARGLLAGLAALTLLLGGGCAPQSATTAPASSVAAGAPTELNVSAAATLKSVLTTTAAAFEKAHNVKLVFNFGASGTLLKQIEGGAPCDVFASASRSQVASAIAEGLASAEASATFASNELVILVPKGNPSGIHGPADLAKATRLTTGDPLVAPHGAKAQEWLTGMGLWGSLKPKFVFAQNAAQTDDYIARGEVDAGLGFASDAHGRADIEIAYVVPKAETKPIAYVVVPIKASKDAELADAYVSYLLSSPVQSALVSTGFKPAPAK
jgi:molybdate transport system substrate-binding protein